MPGETWKSFRASNFRIILYIQYIIDSICAFYAFSLSTFRKIKFWMIKFYMFIFRELVSLLHLQMQLKVDLQTVNPIQLSKCPIQLSKYLLYCHFVNVISYLFIYLFIVSPKQSFLDTMDSRACSPAAVASWAPKVCLVYFFFK